MWELQIIVSRKTQLASCGYNEIRKSMGFDLFRAMLNYVLKERFIKSNSRYK